MAFRRDRLRGPSLNFWRFMVQSSAADEVPFLQGKNEGESNESLPVLRTAMASTPVGETVLG